MSEFKAFTDWNSVSKAGLTIVTTLAWGGNPSPFCMFKKMSQVTINRDQNVSIVHDLLGWKTHPINLP